jgi:membrane glycosyltransferase
LTQASSDAPAPPDVMVELHRALAGQPIERENPAYASIRRRLELAHGAPRANSGSLITEDLQGGVRLAATPPVNRTPMAPEAWPPNLAFRLFRSVKNRVIPARWRSVSQKTDADDIHPDSPEPHSRWQSVATFRWFLLLGLVLAQTSVATYFMTAVLPYHGRQPLEIAILALFAILFGWISIGFWTAIEGFLLLLGRGRFAISLTAPEDAPIDAEARTAIVMPICNENVQRVFAGLRATYESLASTGEQQHFDFFVLSDSSDPDLRVAETEAWMHMRRDIGDRAGIFYRWRQHRIKRKSGNLADFCRRWGKKYRYMVVLDADSAMSGECLTKLVRLMEANPNAGIIQTAPRAAGRDTLHARIQQFATRVYGPIFTAGLHFWHLGEAYYWGHNAIIRVAPFIRHCALGRLPGGGALSGEILSHDFVEAALMRRAGWAVWIAYDLVGSYEEMPPNLVDELGRDRRWCQGNLINSRLLLAEGLHPAHRVVFMTGVMTYLSAPLWFLSLLLSTALLAMHTLVPPQYFVQPHQLFPVWPEWHPEWALQLSSATATLLFLPKILSVALIWAQGAERFGGGFRLAASMVTELLYSTLLAPIRMLFHTQFVAAAMTGWPIHWKSPPREDSETTWGEALRRHGLHTLLGLVWAGGVSWLNPSFLWWLLPVVGALTLSIPISVYSSRISLGRRLRQARLFLIPEESWPPRVLRWITGDLKRAPVPSTFVDAVVDPIVNALICASGVTRIRQSAAIRNSRLRLGSKALMGGPAALTSQEKMTLLSDPVALSRLHFQVWTSPDAHATWLGEQAGTGPMALSAGA